MDSLNVPLPPAVAQRIEALRPALSGFETVRETPTLVLKRFDGALPAGAVESEVRLALADAHPFDVRLDGLDTFETPVSGPAPVAYLAVESPGLEALHAELVDAFVAIAGLEGADYVPHVTVARGGDPSALADVRVEPVEWRATELWFWDARLSERTGRIALGG